MRREVEQRGLKLEEWCRCKRKAASQGTKRAAGGKTEEKEEGGGKADGEEEVRGSSGVQLYNYPD